MLIFAVVLLVLGLNYKATATLLALRWYGTSHTIHPRSTPCWRRDS